MKPPCAQSEHFQLETIGQRASTPRMGFGFSVAPAPTGTEPTPVPALPVDSYISRVVARRNSDMEITGTQLRRVLSCMVPGAGFLAVWSSDTPAPTASEPAAKPPGCSSTAEVIRVERPRCAVGDANLQPSALALAEHSASYSKSAGWAFESLWLQLHRRDAAGWGR